MKGYKAFDKGLICRGKQYAENTVFEEDKAEICKSGMHFCKNPLDGGHGDGIAAPLTLVHDVLVGIAFVLSHLFELSDQ